MSGKKGMRGSGGARPGAGRKPKPPMPTVDSDPVAFLTSVMLGDTLPSPQQLHAATTLARLKASPVGGKKALQTETAATVASGRFSARPAPLKLVGPD